jgi:hypothetical protein
MPAVSNQRRIARDTNSGPVVRAEIARGAVQADQPGQHLDDPPRSNAPRHIDGQALARPFIGDRQTLHRLPIGTGVDDEVVHPHMIDAGGRQWTWSPRRDTATPPFPWDLQSGGLPQAMHPVRAHDMPLARQEHLNPAVPIPRILGRERAHWPEDRRVLRGAHGGGVRSTVAPRHRIGYHVSGARRFRAQKHTR